VASDEGERHCDGEHTLKSKDTIEVGPIRLIFLDEV
jgi:hypothetical protein